METINIRLAAFEGPLDLLYHLIEKNTPSVTISVEGGQTKLKQLTIHELNSMYVPQ